MHEFIGALIPGGDLMMWQFIEPFLSFTLSDHLKSLSKTNSHDTSSSLIVPQRVPRYVSSST